MAPPSSLINQVSGIQAFEDLNEKHITFVSINCTFHRLPCKTYLRHSDAMQRLLHCLCLSRQATSETACHSRGMEGDLCLVSSVFQSIIGRGQQFLALAFTEDDSLKTVSYSK